MATPSVAEPTTVVVKSACKALELSILIWDTRVELDKSKAEPSEFLIVKVIEKVALFSIVILWVPAAIQEFTLF